MGKITTAIRNEYFGSDILVNQTDTNYNLPAQGGLIASQYWLHGIWVYVTGRLTNPASLGPTGTQADHPWSLIENLRVEGYHRIRKNNEVFIDMRGSDLARYNQFWFEQAPFFVNVPSAGGSATAFSTTASATNDFRFRFYVPFVPMNVPLGQQLKWLFDTSNYTNPKLTIRWGSDKSVFTGQTTAPTFTAINSATGSPAIAVSFAYALGGPQGFPGFVPGRVFRTTYEDTSSVETTTGTNQRVLSLPRGYGIKGILIKTGAKSTAINSGENVYNTLSDTIWTNIKLNRGQGHQIRFYKDFFELKQEAAKFFNLAIVPDTGYALLDFCLSRNLGEALDTSQYVIGPSGQIDLFLQADVTGAANQAATFVVEELRFAPER